MFDLGRILIAKLQLDYVCGLRSDRAIKEALVKLPSGIYATYDEILHQLCSKNPDDIEDMKRILHWLACSLEPLTLDQLAEIVSIRAEDRSLDKSGIATDPMDLAACCGSLVTIHIQETLDGGYSDLRGPDITLITLAHASVEEYLKSGKIGRDLSLVFHIDERIVHRKLAKTCLQYIGFEDFETPIEHPVSLETPCSYFPEGRPNSCIERTLPKTGCAPEQLTNTPQSSQKSDREVYLRGLCMSALGCALAPE